MLKREYEGQNCSIACALEIVGERWTLLIVRDAFLGLRRFDEFQESLGIARNVLTDRLHWLVSQDILQAVPYGSRPDRYEYRLTAKGRDLFVTLTACGNGVISTSPTNRPRCSAARPIKPPW